MCAPGVPTRLVVMNTRSDLTRPEYAPEGAFSPFGVGAVRGELAFLCFLLSVAVLGLGPVGPSVGARPAPATSATGATPTSLVWRRCTDELLAFLKLQCARLSVPLDHADPTGPRISLALTRRPHRPGLPYRGVMLINPGGPGVSGRDLASTGDDNFPRRVGGSYDWIGFDPRGVGDSEPSLRCTAVPARAPRPTYVAENAELVNYWRARSRQFSSACADSAQRELLAHMSSLDTVADIESIREALGARRINWYGFSYGSYLGQLYATAHPDRVSRMILDGVVNPRHTWYGNERRQEAAFDRNAERFWTYLAHHRRLFHLGTDRQKIRQRYYRELRRLARKPRGKFGAADLADAMSTLAYNSGYWADLGDALSKLLRHGDPALLAQYVGIGTEDPTYAAYLATECTDAPWPGTRRVLADARRLHHTRPFAAWRNTWLIAPCLTWPAPAAQHRPRIADSPALPPILLVNDTYDAPTPFSGALKARKIFRRSVLVEGRGGYNHANSLSSTCEMRIVTRYLISRTLPHRVAGNRSDAHCPGDELPTARTPSEALDLPKSRVGAIGVH
jgi:pimeloyl-ACP methyl ester carboxylesterase